MYISKAERQKLQESKKSPVTESIDKYEVLESKVDRLFEMFNDKFGTSITEATVDGDEITVEVDGEVVTDTEPEVEEPTIETPVDEYGPKLAMASMLMAAIQDEYKTIQLYNDMIATANTEGFEDAVKVLKHINEEESIHVGMLQTLLSTIDDSAKEVSTGNDEAAEIINNEEDLEVTDTAIEA